MTRLVWVLIAVAACRPSTTMVTLSSECCACPPSEQTDAAVDAGPDAEPDAPVDAPIDAAPDPPPPPDAAPPNGPLSISLTAAWTRHTLIAGSYTGSYRGADGVSLGPDGCLYTAWEEGAAVTRACGTLTELVATGLAGVEDARAADLDGDDIVDVVSCSDSGSRCYVTFRGPPNVTVTLTGSMGHGRVMQAAIADVDGDGDPDVLFGTRVGSPAVVAWLANPGPSSARTGSAWTYHYMGTAGWVMSLLPRDIDFDGDIDVVVSDRTYYGAHLWDLNGVRWLEQTATGWTNHPISPPSGSCPAGVPMCTTKTPGDVMFASIDGNDVWGCQSSDGASYSRIVRYRTTDWLTWTTTVLPAMLDVGHCQAAYAADVDRDGLIDVVVSAWKGNALPLAPAAAAQSGVYWLRNTGTGWARGEISGTVGAKFDNAIVQDVDGDGDLDVIDSEQLEQLGVLWFENPGVPL